MDISDKVTKSTEVISKLNVLKVIFRNETQIVTDKGTTLRSNLFAECYEQEEIKHNATTIDLTRANEQVEQIHQIVILVLEKQSSENPSQWNR